jgi:hypothetical protein
MNNKLKKIYNEEVMVKFKTISQNLPRGAEENHEKPHGGEHLDITFCIILFILKD